MEKEECDCFSGMLMMIIWLVNTCKRDTCKYGKWLIMEVKREGETVANGREESGLETTRIYVMKIERNRKYAGESMCVVWWEMKVCLFVTNVCL